MVAPSVAPTTNRISSSGLSRPDRFKLDQSPQPVFPGRQRKTTGTATVLVALVLVVFLHWRERATLPGGFILSPSATLRVAGLAPADEGGAPHCLTDLRPRGPSLLGLSWPMARG